VRHNGFHITASVLHFRLGFCWAPSQCIVGWLNVTLPMSVCCSAHLLLGLSVNCISSDGNHCSSV
jgi:hypothetical protein